MVSEAERGLEELEVRVWGRVSEMAEAPLQEEAGRQTAVHGKAANALASRRVGGSRMRQSPGHITTEESTEALDLLKVWELVLRRESDGFEVG